MDKYKDNLGLRYNTMSTAFKIFEQNKGKVIVETGTTRYWDDWGAGYSTVVFADSLKKGKVITVDILEVALNTCKEITKDFNNIEYVLSDSLKFLEEYKGPIDLLYLDSYDYPYGTLLDYYGGQTDIKSAEATLRSMKEGEIVEKHFSAIIDSQEHQLKEFKAAEKKLKKGTPILLDDSDLPGGGKSRLTKMYLNEIGATCILDEYQSLWIL